MSHTAINTRYPEDVLEGIRELANKHGRSFNGEVIWALRQYIDADKSWGEIRTMLELPSIDVWNTGKITKENKQ